MKLAGIKAGWGGGGGVRKGEKGKKREEGRGDWKEKEGKSCRKARA